MSDTTGATVEVTTPLGTLRGSREDDVCRFRGVRYASAERFGRPVPVTGWTGVQDALRHGAQSPQLLGPLEAALGGSAIPQAEDCLFLSVTTPGCDEGARPVLVWIHGGAYVTGTGAMPWYHGGNLARRGDVVVVSINYRLGVLGYLGTGDLGLDDQLTALEWVRDNIASFGGDPGNVTVFGESAGGSAVLAVLAAPRSAGLAHRAWAMSPSIGQLRGRERAEAVRAQVLAYAGCDDVDQLARVDVETVLAAQAEVLAVRGAGFDGFAPTAGGDVVAGSITEAAARSHVPLVLGTTRDENTLFLAMDPRYASLDEAGLLAEVEQRFPGRADDVVALYRDHRPGESPVRLLAAVQTDQTFRVPAHRLADARVAAGTPTWATWFTWQSTGFGGTLGACHGLDIPFAFDNLHQPGVERFTGDGPGRQEVADAHSEALLTFARTGLAPWPPLADGSRPTLCFDETTTVVDDPEPALRHLWGPGEAGA